MRISTETAELFALPSAMRCISDVIEILRDYTLEAEKFKKPGDNNIQIQHSGSPTSPQIYSIFTLYSSQALRELAVVEE